MDGFHLPPLIEEALDSSGQSFTLLSLVGVTGKGGLKLDRHWRYHLCGDIRSMGHGVMCVFTLSSLLPNLHR